MSTRARQLTIAPLTIAFLAIFVGDALYHEVTYGIHHPSNLPTFRENQLYFVVKFILIFAVSAAVMVTKMSTLKSALAIGAGGVVFSGLISSNAFPGSSDFITHLAYFAIMFPSAWVVLRIMPRRQPT